MPVRSHRLVLMPSKWLTAGTCLKTYLKLSSGFWIRNGRPFRKRYRPLLNCQIIKKVEHREYGPPRKLVRDYEHADEAAES